MAAERTALRLPALAELLAHPRMVWVVMLLALLLGLASLSSGLVADDWSHRAFLRGWQEGTSDRPWWDLFVIHEHEPARVIGLRTSGHRPWWVDPELHIAFFRPVAVASHHLDYWLWPDSPWLMHLHSVVWHAACCAMAWLVARRLASSPRVAGIAAIIYALSFTHLVATSWLAYRNGLICTFWALVALLAHVHWRSEKSRFAAAAAPLCLATGLLAAEAGVAALAYIVSYELLLAEDSWRRRIVALVPSVVVVGLWRLLYDTLGYGVSYSGGYIDPVAEPLVFLQNLPARLGTLLTLCVSPPYVADLSAPVLGLWLVATIIVGVGLLVFLRLTRGGVACFGMLATVLACVPLAASFPLDRVLVLASFGVALALGELLDAWLLRRAGKLATATAGAVVVVHLVAPLPAGIYVSTNLDRVIGLRTAAYGPDLKNEGLSKRGLVIVHTPHYPAVDMLLLNRATRRLPVPNFVWTLHEGPERPTMRCIDDKTIELVAPELGWPGGFIGMIFRSTTARPFTVGEQVRTLDYTATVDTVDNGRATSVRFEFRAPLDHPSFAWATWEGSELVPLDPNDLCN